MCRLGRSLIDDVDREVSGSPLSLSEQVMKLTVGTFVTLDGVMQAPAAPRRTAVAGFSTVDGSYRSSTT